MTLIHINVPRPDEMKIKRVDCPTCKKDRFFLVYHEEWYGFTHVCLKCGERWQDGERCERPFCRGWRKDSVKQARDFFRRWKRTTSDERISSAAERVLPLTK